MKDTDFINTLQQREVKIICNYGSPGIPASVKSLPLWSPCGLRDEGNLPQDILRINIHARKQNIRMAINPTALTTIKYLFDLTNDSRGLL